MSYKLILAIILFSISTLSAQEEWTLERCIRHAWEENLTIQQSEISIKSAEIDRKQSIQSRYPSLDANTSINSNFGRSIDPVTNAFITENFLSNNLSLSTGVTIFNGFRISNAIKQAEIDRDAATYDLEQMKRDIALNIANSYLNVLFAEENLNIAKSQKNTSEQQLIQIQKLITVGLRPSNESLDIEAQIAMNDQSVIQAENSKEIALLSLKQLLRIDPNVVVNVVAPKDVNSTTDPDLLDFDGVYGIALSNQANIKAGALRVESARMNAKIANASLLPSISAGASLGTNYSNQAKRILSEETRIVEEEIFFNGTSALIGRQVTVPTIGDNPYFNQLDQNLSYGLGLSMQIPIYNNFQARGNIERAKLNILNADIQNEQTKDRLKTSVQQALADAKASKRKLEASRKSLAAQQGSFEYAEKKFNAGTINSFEYTTIKNNLQQAQVNEILSKYEFLFALKVLDFYMNKPLGI